MNDQTIFQWLVFSRHCKVTKIAANWVKPPLGLPHASQDPMTRSPTRLLCSAKLSKDSKEDRLHHNHSKLPSRMESWVPPLACKENALTPGSSGEPASAFDRLRASAGYFHRLETGHGFSTGDSFAPPEILDNVWRQFWLSGDMSGRCYWHVVDRNRGCF